jgi:hypothetical protein
MNTVINQHLFRHRESKSSAFNNLCTLIHKLPEEGIYAGEVVQGKRLLGSFRLTCDAKNDSSQVNIDLSSFDALFRANLPQLRHATDFAVGKDGYMVLHASGHHDGLYVRLTKLAKEKPSPAFDSRRLEKGDLVAFRLWQPGAYTITNEPGGQKAALSVRETDSGKYPDLTKLEPVRVTLSDRGFEPAKVEKWPAQALVVTLETSGSLTLHSTKEPPVKVGASKGEPPTAKKATRT